MIFNLQCVSKANDSFVYEYDLSDPIIFNFEESLSVTLGSVKLLNEDDKKKKFRYIKDSPRGYFFNKKTKNIKEVALVVKNNEPEKVDSLFWALLGSATYYTPVKPYGFTKITLYLNINFHPQPRELKHYIVKNHKNLEYHIFNPLNYPVNLGKENFNHSPDFVIRSIQVGKK